MEEGTKIKTSLGKRKKRKTKSTLFEWTETEELNLLKKLVEFSTSNIAHEEFYPFVRKGSLAEVSKMKIFEKIQELKRKYLEKLESGKEEDEGFELSKQIWSEETKRAGNSNSKALDQSYKQSFERLVDKQGLELDLFTPSFLESTKKEAYELFTLEDQYFLIKTNMKAQLAQLKCNILEAKRSQ